MSDAGNNSDGDSSPEDLESLLSEDLTGSVEDILVEIASILDQPMDILKIGEQSPPKSVTITTDGQSIIIAGNGDVSFDPPCTPSEGARAFWEAVRVHGSEKEQIYYENWQKAEDLILQMRHGIGERSELIDKLIAEIDNLKCNGPDLKSTERFKAIAEDEND